MEGTFNVTSSNSSLVNSTTKVYTAPPISLRTKIIFTLLVVLIGIGGVMTNSLLLYLTRKQETIRKRGRGFKTFRRTLTTYFIKSLALSDFLASLVNLPIFMSELYSDILQNDWGCRFVRHSNLFFGVVTLNNLFVIGIERYMAIFHPFLLPAPRFSKNLVIGAWVAAGLFVIAPTATFKSVPVDLEPDVYTVVCRYNKTVPVYRAMFISFLIVCYVIPSFILTITNIRIMTFLNRNKIHSKPNQLAANSWRFKGTKMFLSLIFAFTIPYFLYVVYTCLFITLKIKLSFTADYVIRRVSGIIAYSNALISPSVIFYNMSDIRNLLRNVFWSQRNPIVHTHTRKPTTENAMTEDGKAVQNETDV